MLQIIDIENQELFIPVSSEESATLIGGITGVNLANIQDGINNISNRISLFSIDGNKLFTIDLSRLTINMVYVLPIGAPQVFRWTN
ncbi:MULTISPECIES: hypothetical protein [unclassified Anabaena]|uniref:hypothetical protein n=1 Tax=unclassified Anabaena TaxID=2619674 RepID=UPI0039C6508E